MKCLTRNETAAFLQQHDHYAIVSHKRPDGDTLGSTAALCRCLRAMGKTAHVLTNSEATARYAWLHEGLTKDAPQEGDTIVSVDVASPAMLPKDRKDLEGKIALRIDHHDASTSFTEWELVEPEMAACGEIIYELTRLLGVEMDPDMADAVYVATATDTGCFRFSNTTDHTFRTAAECMKAGARVFRLNQQLFETNSLAKMRIQSWIVENMKLLSDGKLALVAIPKEVELSLGVTEDDMDNISNFPRTIEGVCMAATLRETGNGGTKISVRAVPGYDATQITVPFGGGGHKGAAGASLDMPIAEAERKVEAALLEMA